MTPLSYPRRLASQLLRAALSIAPHDTLDWGNGMLSELNHVEGNWSALLWAFGGAGVLAKHAVLSAIFTGSTRPILPSGGDLFEKETPMRKTVLTAIGACVVASLLFFAAPVFRQAFHVSLAQWHDVLHVGRTFGTFGTFGYEDSSPELERLAKKAEQNRDAEGLAFVAARHPNPDESVRLVEEAVQLDPSLTWVYAVIAAQSCSLPHFDRWVSELKKYDSQNALPYFIVAEKIDCDEVGHKTIRPALLKGIMSGREEHENPAWQTAMAAAFQSHKLDTYLDRLKELDRKALIRYHVDDPFQAVSDDSWWRGLPSYSAWDSSRYAQSVLESGEALEARGDRDGAVEKYMSVARFTKMMGPAGVFWLPRVDQEAYKRLASLFERGANKEQAEFYAALADQADQAQKAELDSMRSWSRGGEVAHWNAFLVRLSGLVLLFCAALLVFCISGVLVRGRSFKLASLHPGRLTLALGLGAALGVLLSSAVLFVSYWPYSELLQRFQRTGDEAGLSDLARFLGDAQLPLGSQLSAGSWYVGSQKAVFYFWFSVVALCVLAFLLVLWRFRHRPRAAAATT